MMRMHIMKKNNCNQSHSERDYQSSVLGDSLDYGLDELSQHIVERLLARIQDNGRQD